MTAVATPLVAGGYRPRLVRPFPPFTAAGRTMKLYGLFKEAARLLEFPSRSWLTARVPPLLGEPHPADEGVGFVMLHYGADGLYLLASEWHGGDMLRHNVFAVEPDRQGRARFVALSPGDLTICVWELEIMRFERDAWVRTVMASDRPRSEAVSVYLAEGLSGWV